MSLLNAIRYPDTGTKIGLLAGLINVWLGFMELPILSPLSISSIFSYLACGVAAKQFARIIQYVKPKEKVKDHILVLTLTSNLIPLSVVLWKYLFGMEIFPAALGYNWLLFVIILFTKSFFHHFI